MCRHKNLTEASMHAFRGKFELSGCRACTVALHPQRHLANWRDIAHYYCSYQWSNLDYFDFFSFRRKPAIDKPCSRPLPRHSARRKAKRTHVTILLVEPLRSCEFPHLSNSSKLSQAQGGCFELAPGRAPFVHTESLSCQLVGVR